MSICSYCLLRCLFMYLGCIPGFSLQCFSSCFLMIHHATQRRNTGGWGAPLGVCTADPVLSTVSLSNPCGVPIRLPGPVSIRDFKSANVTMFIVS